MRERQPTWLAARIRAGSEVSVKNVPSMLDSVCSLSSLSHSESCEEIQFIQREFLLPLYTQTHFSIFFLVSQLINGDGFVRFGFSVTWKSSSLSRCISFLLVSKHRNFCQTGQRQLSHLEIASLSGYQKP